jgi:hypothetical protein
MSAHYLISLRKISGSALNPLGQEEAELKGYSLTGLSLHLSGR